MVPYGATRTSIIYWYSCDDGQDASAGNSFDTFFWECEVFGQNSSNDYLVLRYRIFATKDAQ